MSLRKHSSTIRTMENNESGKSQRTYLQHLNNVIKRVTFGVLMISGFLIIILIGPIMLMFLAFIIQVLCFREILKIGYDSNKLPHNLPYFRFLCWYFLMVANYFFSVETIAPHFQDYYTKFYNLKILISYHRFISFCAYFGGIVLFVLSLVRKYDLKQFKIFAWTHTLLILIVLQSYLVIDNMFNGLIWLILPVSLVILNDIFAYLFGRLYGKTPLIKLSPKKTWEGFIGGVVGTFISGFILSNIMCQFKYFVCPIEYYETESGVAFDCTPSYLFNPKKISVWIISLDFYPFTYHFIALALFASIVAPFGGFCASGFKRAFKLKDFGDVIPGHGGIMDRFDCQFLMATFVNVYIFTFVKSPSVELIFEKILYLDESKQLQFYYLLRDFLQASEFDNSI
ncbi:phosphatidate cytidylyltransferase, photoreceptor-specific-like [Tribolium madens]|uniref:phosphatidate cytidylyltransferase, photoreceptor-specific-like n=1 Tax=Tribolium madens TaxID=41895 RepID=UPI001CF721E5|nr:phosphatidate cytidylyltransferase, photoreceptor-specific-like [Tribolium madens]XP_044267243.1 phosphatidate cytidylyltransferase, photoreceptor-specific-like [Tribolium madens]XP_044267244.1 phosphatidate cytidylyltransferase, photoreceptor-specific-like [Tribolium madens]XP_044267245.1 phosphatidate cytidylyltransferase, photoreceptor-specific-like [Tribolium madens]